MSVQMYPVRRGLLMSQSQLLAKIPPILAFFNNAPDSKKATSDIKRFGLRHWHISFKMAVP